MTLSPGRSSARPAVADLVRLFALLAMSGRRAWWQALLVGAGLAALLSSGLPDPAARPFAAAVFRVLALVPSLLLAVVPAGPVGAILLAEIGRPPVPFLVLLRAAWRGTFVQLLVMVAALFAWAVAAGSAAAYAVAELGTDFDAAARTVEISVQTVGGALFAVFVAASALTMIDVQHGGPPTVRRSFALLRRAPVRAMACAVLGALPGFAAGFAASRVAAAGGASGLWIDAAGTTCGAAAGAWTITAALFAHYRITFGAEGAPVK